MLPRSCRVALAFTLTVAFVHAAGAAVSKTESREGKERVLILENEHLKVAVFPDLGGRIGHLIDKADGDDILYWHLSPKAVYKGEGGLLDDRRNTFVPYEILPPPKGAPEHAVRLKGPGDSPAVEKTITLLPDAPTIRVDYVYGNPTQQDLTDYSVMTKNWFLPSGGKVTTDDLYCLPTSRGVRRIQGLRANFSQYPELRGKFKQDVGSWNGFLNVPKRRGAVAAFSNDFYRWFYMWKGGVEIPTYEWVFKPLPAGRQTAVTVWIHVVRGLKGYSHANRYAVADLRYDEKAGRVITDVVVPDPRHAATRVETEVRRLPNGAPIRVATTALPAADAAKVQNVSVAWRPDVGGTYVIRQRLLADKTILAELEEPFVVGNPSGEYVRADLFPAVAQLKTIRGWRRIPVQDIVKPGPADVKRGFLVYLDQFGVKDQRGRPMNRYALNMGLGETKAFELKVRALADLKGLTVSVQPGSLRPEQVEIFGIELVDVSDEKVGKTGQFGRKMVSWQSMDVKKGADLPVWIRVHSPDAGPGDKQFSIRVAAEGRPSAEVDVTLKVWPVPLPRPNLISLETEHSTMILPGCWNAKAQQWNREVVERYCRDLGNHLTDFEQGFWGWGRGARDNGMLKLATTGEPLRAFLAKKPDLTNAPPLDFSYLNPVFDAAIRNGMVRFSANMASLPPKPAIAWLWREAARYLRDRGYPAEDIWCKHLDEQPATNFPKMVRNVQWLRQNGWRPYSTFHNVLAQKDFMETLKSGFDMYQGGFPTHRDLADRVGDGSLKPGDEVWMYQGWGATWIPYASNRSRGWFAAAAMLDGYHVHVYYRWHKLDAIIFPSDTGPTDTPAWEAIRDGFADAQYVALARRWIQRLGDKSAGARLALIVGGKDALVRLERKRDRLTWVERLGDIDVATFERGRGELLKLLADLAPKVKQLGSSLYYGSRTLAENGKVRLVVSSGASRKGVDQLAAALKQRFDIVPRTGKPTAGDIVVDFRTGNVPDAWTDTKPHVTDRYPAAGEYVIHMAKSRAGEPTHLLIFGRDETGLEKGIEMWTCFLRSERRGAVR